MIRPVAKMNFISQSSKCVEHIYKGKPQEFANVVLQTGDSTFVTGVSTNAKGRFQIDKVATGNYRLIISAIGYITNITDRQPSANNASASASTSRKKNRWIKINRSISICGSIKCYLCIPKLIKT